MAQQYRPLFKLDAGGMAEVYVAEAEALQGFKKRVAIKRILPGMLKDERYVRMFLDEARLSLHLSHANIVSVFDIGKSDNSYFIVMEYIDGCTLKSTLEFLHARDRRVSVALTIWILNEVLKGLDYAHNLTDADGRTRLGIVHRDISPPNILMSWNGEVKLADFGLAKATTQLESTDPGVVKGKFSYLSPEAAWAQPVDHRTDIYAVGILGYEMLTGRRLFVGESDWQTIEMVRASEVPSISAQVPEVPAQLEQIIRKALARDVQVRYQSCSEFADDLLSVLFAYGQRVSSRDLAALLAEVKASKPRAEDRQAVTGQSNIIMQLLADEIAQFRSLDEEDEAGSSGGHADDAYDPARPLAFGDFGDDLGPGPAPSAALGGPGLGAPSVVSPLPPRDASVVRAPPSRATQAYPTIPLATAAGGGRPGSRGVPAAHGDRGGGDQTAPHPVLGQGPPPPRGASVITPLSHSAVAPMPGAGPSRLGPLPGAPAGAASGRMAGPMVETQYGAVPVAVTRLPSPPPKEVGSPAWLWAVLAVLLLGGGAVAVWFLVLNPP